MLHDRTGKLIFYRNDRFNNEEYQHLFFCFFFLFFFLGGGGVGGVRNAHSMNGSKRSDSMEWVLSPLPRPQASLFILAW